MLQEASANVATVCAELEVPNLVSLWHLSAARPINDLAPFDEETGVACEAERKEKEIIGRKVREKHNKTNMLLYFE
jgi:hypothetical protein